MNKPLTQTSTLNVSIRSLRQRLGVSQSEASEAIGVSVALFCLFESGQRRLRRERLELLLNFLRQRAAELVKRGNVALEDPLICKNIA